VGDITIPAYFDLLSQSVNAFVPQQLSLGGRWSPTPQFRVNAEVTWVNWSAYVSPIGRSSIILDIAVPPELADTIRVPGTIVGSEPIAANFQDRVVPRVGVEGLASSAANYELLVRGGAFYEHSPVPDQTGLSNLVDTDRLALSAGAGLRLTELRPVLDGWLSFDLHLQWALLPERIARKSSPVDPVGDWRASGHIFGGGLTMEVGFR
jgi:long-chain fatty acid transport protein